MTGHTRIVARYAILCAALAVVVWLAIRLARSERLRIAWNGARYFYDGRHKLHADSAAVILDTSGELWIRDAGTGEWVRIVPRAGVDLAGEQNVSFSSARSGARTMYKLRPQFDDDARADATHAAWPPPSNSFSLYIEQRHYSNDLLVSYYKDCAFGPGGLFFTRPDTGRHVAQSNFSTVYVPEPVPGSGAGPDAWLWAAAANRRFVEHTVTGPVARSTWDHRYLRRVAAPASPSAPGAPGDIAWDGTYLYLYSGQGAGWRRVALDATW